VAAEHARIREQERETRDAERLKYEELTRTKRESETAAMKLANAIVKNEFAMGRENRDEERLILKGIRAEDLVKREEERAALKKARESARAADQKARELERAAAKTLRNTKKGGKRTRKTKKVKKVKKGTKKAKKTKKGTRKGTRKGGRKGW
jgi:hypothetical protein